MTKDQIEAVLERVKTWSEDRQAEALQVLLALEREAAEPYVLTEDERADIEQGLAEADRGEFASDEEVAAVFNRYRR